MRGTAARTSGSPNRAIKLIVTTSPRELTKSKPTHQSVRRQRSERRLKDQRFKRSLESLSKARSPV